MDREPEATLPLPQPELPIEGEGDPASIGSYPIDSLLIRTDQRTVHDVLRREQQGYFILDPDFQRAFVWEPERQSRLIESLLMRIPLPVFYLAENPDGRLVVVDGLQRLGTLKRFIANEQPLLVDNPELRGKTFDTLSPKFQNRIEDAQLTLYIIDAKVPDRVRLDIFERVNSGRPLTRQQMRNALYQGKATEFLKAAALTPEFKDATIDAFPPEEMKDREAINRFCSFYLLGPETFKGDIDAFLADGLKELNSKSSEDIEELMIKFRMSMKANAKIFGENAFRKHSRDQSRRHPINLSLFDIFSVLFAKFDANTVYQSRDAIREGFFDLQEDDKFVSAITTATSDIKKVANRFKKLEAMIEGAIA